MLLTFHQHTIVCALTAIQGVPYYLSSVDLEASMVQQCDEKYLPCEPVLQWQVAL